MYARSMLRSAAPLRRGVRGYASQGGGSGGIGAIGYTAIAGAAGIGGYYYYANVLGKAKPIPNAPDPSSLQQMAGGGSGKAAAENPPKAFQGGEQGFIALKLDSVRDVNHNTKAFVFALPEGNQISGLPIASAIITKFQADGQEKPTIRPYTPTSDEHRQGYVELMIKKYPNGPMSEHIHSMKPGDTLEVKGPIPKYKMDTNKHNHIAMIAGGTGVTPMWQVIRAIFKDPEDKTKVTLVFGNVSKEDILLKEEFDHLENTYPQRFRAFYVLDNPPEGWEQGKGFITKDLLKTVLPEPKEENIKVFVCGPPGLYKAVSGAKKSPQDQGELDGALKELGYSQDQVFKF